MEDSPRVARLKRGDWSFGHDGKHFGVGTETCPSGLHHHCDDFCRRPTKEELRLAGIDPAEFKIRSRA